MSELGYSIHTSSQIHRAHGYVAPRLFDGWEAYKADDRELRAYIEQEMAKLADAGELYVTDLLNQQRRLSEVAGQIILGQAHYRGAQAGMSTMPVPIHPSIKLYKVHVKSTQGRNLRVRMPRRNDEEARREMTGEVMATVATAMIPGGDKVHSKLVDVEKVYDVKEGELPINEAWVMLRQYGMFVTKREKMWRYVETKVLDRVERPSEKRGPGRPRKTT